MPDKERLTKLFDTFEKEIKEATNTNEEEFVPILGLSEEDIKDLPEENKQIFYSDEIPTSYDEDKPKYINVLSYVIDNGPVTKEEIQSEPPGSEIPTHKINWIMRVLTSRQLVEEEGDHIKMSRVLSKKLE
ncbi:hypothetical protein [Halorubrum sp. 48-1-W]|uniref:hypothetical protein n=1 Tax=Halorubrum sp. 48-1-W TaxID=2249761 RepID=UPI000FCA7736|nr:hypothetical protein [Halorubrum sp. 48-1-W]